MSWEDLQFYHNLKDAAALSGWTASTWRKKSNPIKQYAWSDLTPDEQDGETLLGMTPMAWDYCIDGRCIPCEESAAAAALEEWQCTVVPTCMKWPGGCCGEYGNCTLGPGGASLYIGCSATMSRCQEGRQFILQNDIDPDTGEGKCGNGSAMWKKGAWMGGVSDSYSDKA